MTWCLALLTTPADADAIMGDLQEERLAIAARDGERFATWWYRRQVLRTVVHLTVAPIHDAPLAFVTIGISGFALILPFTWTAMWLAGQIVVQVPMYQYVPATVFWRGVSLLPHVAVGALIGAAMGRKAMSSAVAVCAAMTVHAALLNPILLVTRLPPEHVPTALDYMARTIPVFSMFALAIVAATAAGSALRQQLAAHLATRATSTT